MESIVGVFNSVADAKRGAAVLCGLGIPEQQISVLAPGTSDAEVEASVLTTETEQPGMGRALGATVGGSMGVAGGFTAGVTAASMLIPEVGAVLVFGLIGAALLGAGGATVGGVAGEALEAGIAQGLPRDELYVYEDALRSGRSVVIAIADDAETAQEGRAGLIHAGAESIDTARQEWWIGLRDAEQEHYTKEGGDFKLDEAQYRLGFEAALHPHRRGQTFHSCRAELQERYGAACGAAAFYRGYERGQRYQNYIRESFKKAA